MNESSGKLKDPGRRNFLMNILLGVSSLAGIIIAVPVVGALLDPLLKKPPKVWRRVGEVDSFKIGDTVLVRFKNASPLPWSGMTSETASWVRRVSENEFIAFSVNCAHLGCPVRWIPDSELFLCPCHGGVYNRDGSYAAGPPPHGLSRYPWRIKNNQLEIETSPIPITTM